VVNARRLPIENAGELPIDHEELVLVDISVDEDVGELRCLLQALTPLFDSIDAIEAMSRFDNGSPTGVGIERSAKPTIVGTIVVGGRARTWYLGRLNVVPPGDEAVQRVDQVTCVGGVSSGKPRHGGERVGIHRVIPPLLEQLRNDRELNGLECSVRGELSFEPLNALRISRKQIGAVGGEENELVPSSDVHVQLFIINLD
jgi:hypothetical protein